MEKKKMKAGINLDTDIQIRMLDNTEAIPYSLLLLADENMEAVQKYIFTSEIYIVEHKGEIIGVLVLTIRNSEAIEIKNLAVDEPFQGKGIGSYLLDYAAEQASKRGFSSILIGTGDQSVKQLALYKKCGFKDFEIIRQFFINNYPEPIYENGSQLIDMVLLKKQIG